MISDEPDEDADPLEDEDLFGELADGGGPKTEARRERVAYLREWPPLPQASNDGLFVDSVTLGWFKANHADWRAEIATVLRAWVSLNVRDEPHDLATLMAPPPTNW